MMGNDAKAQHRSKGSELREEPVSETASYQENVAHPVTAMIYQNLQWSETSGHG